MSLTWSDLKNRIRAEANDATEPYEWSDALLYIWLKDALADYSMYAPLETVATLTDKSGASYALPVNCVRVEYVECPLGTYLKPGLSRPNVKLSARFNVWRYHVTATTLTINRETEQDVVLTYKALHSAPSAVDDDTFVFTFVDRDAELISLFVRGKSFEQMRGKQSSLDRFQLGGGDRTDNPVEPEVNNMMREYERKIARRYGGGTITLYRR